MSGVNMVILMGNLGNDPEVRYSQAGLAVANFRMATSKTWTDKHGDKKERTEWHRVVVWGKQAELCGEYLAKGRQAHVTGELQTREWTDKENKKQWTTEIVAREVIFVGGKKEGQTRRPEPQDDFGPPPSGYGSNSSTRRDAVEPLEDEIPF